MVAIIIYYFVMKLQKLLELLIYFQKRRKSETASDMMLHIWIARCPNLKAVVINNLQNKLK